MIISVIAGMLITTVVSWTTWNFYWPDTTDPRIATWVEEYQMDALTFGIKVDPEDLRYIGVADLGDNLAGLGIPPHVLLSKEYIQNKEVLYHELTHALFACSGHIPNEDDSIMNSNGSVWSMTWDQSVRKLFTKDIYTLKCLEKL